MKLRTTMILMSLAVGPQALACMGSGPFMICPGDTVYKGGDYSRGAEVLGENMYRNTVTVRSISSGSTFEEDVAGLDVAKGCLAPGICAGKVVYKGGDYSRGAKVLGLNPSRMSATVQSISSSSLFEETVAGLYVSEGCARGVCVGALVYKGGDYSRGAEVMGINRAANSATVRSISSGSLFAEDLSGLSVSRGCFMGVCAGDIVFKGSDYSRGAKVLGLNFAQGSVTVQSISSGSLFQEDPRALDVTTFCNDYDDATRRGSMGPIVRDHRGPGPH